MTSLASQQLGLFEGDISALPVPLTAMSTYIKLAPPFTASFPSVQATVPKVIEPLFRAHNSLTMVCGGSGPDHVGGVRAATVS